MIHLCERGKKYEDYIDVTSRSKTWSRGLSPFLIGPCPLYGDYIAKRMESGWQFSKCYAQHADENGDPTPAYFEWAQAGWNNSYGERYPMGKGARPLYTWWDGQKLDYVTARIKVYAPLYAAAVETTPSYQRLKDLYAEKGELWLWDFDVYSHRDRGMTFEDVMKNAADKCGHGFILAMMLMNDRVWERL